MLDIVIKAGELWDEENERFINIEKDQHLSLEHSLLSISKWESKWAKPFFGKEAKTIEETIDYVKCMTLNKPSNDDCYYGITGSIIQEVNAYIDAPMTATWFNEMLLRETKSSSREIPTSELIYYWMKACGIPFTCEKWHLKRLITLIRICSIKNSPNKKISKSALVRSYSELNRQRLEQLGTTG